MLPFLAAAAAIAAVTAAVKHFSSDDDTSHSSSGGSHRDEEGERRVAQRALVRRNATVQLNSLLARHGLDPSDAAIQRKVERFVTHNAAGEENPFADAFMQTPPMRDLATRVEAASQEIDMFDAAELALQRLLKGDVQ